MVDKKILSDNLIESWASKIQCNIESKSAYKQGCKRARLYIGNTTKQFSEWCFKSHWSYLYIEKIWFNPLTVQRANFEDVFLLFLNDTD